jgi:hypothetical protein
VDSTTANKVLLSNTTSFREAPINVTPISGISQRLILISFVGYRASLTRLRVSLRKRPIKKIVPIYSRLHKPALS